MQMTEHKWDVFIGCLCAAVSLFFVLFFNNAAIEIPSASYQADSAAITPAFFPDMICWSMLFFSIGLIISGWKRIQADNADPDFVHTATPFDRRAFAFRMCAMATLVLLFVIAEWLGILIAGFIFYLLFSFFTGERKPARAVFGALLTTAILYYLFVHLAAVPLPTGILSDFL